MTGQTFLIFIVVAALLLAGVFWLARGAEPLDEHGRRRHGSLVGAIEEQLSSTAATVRGGAARDGLLEVFVVVSAILLALGSLHVYWGPTHQLLAAPDYAAETIPALNGLHDSGLRGYLDHLPGYPGIMMVQLIPSEIANLLGLSEPTTWRFLSCVGIASIALSILAALPLLRVSPASRGSVRTAIVLAGCSPAAYWALRIGHPEEVLTTGLLLGAVIAAAKERPVIAAILLGFAIGKAWPAVAALPVIGLLLPDIRRTLVGCVVTAVTIAVIYLPPLLFANHSVQVLSKLGQKGIFNVGQVFWWFGTPLPASVVRDPAQQSVPQPRGLGPEWS
ncbi:MAG: glycosyltransferase 87 family protein, partial [Solirubrobacteraceae bacterium]